MNIKLTKIKNLYLIKNKEKKDLRGNFVKVFSNQELLLAIGKSIKIKESFISENKKNVIRGMHIQVNQSKSYKFVTCLRGRILDVCIDLRKKSDSFLKVYHQTLNSYNYNTILIPPGVGHGFLSLSSNSQVLYEITKNYIKKDDIAIDYNSIGFNWPIKKPIQSIRDKSAMKLEKFLLEHKNI